MVRVRRFGGAEKFYRPRRTDFLLVLIRPKAPVGSLSAALMTGYLRFTPLWTLGFFSLFQKQLQALPLFESRQLLIIRKFTRN